MTISLNHIALIVRDPDKTAALFESLFAAEIIRPDGGEDSPHDILVKLGDIWLVLAPGEPQPELAHDHIAFSIDASELSQFEQRIAALGLRSQKSREGTGMESLYFVDYDNHLFELATGEVATESK